MSKFHKETFLLFLGDSDPSYKALSKYREYLIEIYAKKGTRQAKWSAAVNHSWRFLEGNDLEKKTKLFEIMQRIPFGADNTKHIKRLTDNEHKKFYDLAKNDRQRFWIKWVRELDLRAGQLSSLKLYDDIVTEKCREEALDAFHSKKYLCETRNGNPFARTQLSDEIARLSDKVWDRRLRLEHLRKPKEQVH